MRLNTEIIVSLLDADIKEMQDRYEEMLDKANSLEDRVYDLKHDIGNAESYCSHPEDRSGVGGISPPEYRYQNEGEVEDWEDELADCKAELNKLIPVLHELESKIEKRIKFRDMLMLEKSA